MAIVQVGYLSNQGPVFVDDQTAGAGKYIVLQGQLKNGAMHMVVVQPAYAANLANFPYTAAQCSLGPYSDNQDIGLAPAYTQPATLGSGYDNKQTTWVPGNTVANAPQPTTPTPAPAPAPGGTPAPAPASGGAPAPAPAVFQAPDTTTQVETFLSKYWWAILLVAVALLWKPVIAPALGIRQRRTYRR